jgi:hypothetical protein
MYKGYDQSFETTVTVVDMDGKPVKERIVKALKGFNFSGRVPTDSRLGGSSATTDANGQVVLKYELNISSSSQDYMVIAADDDILFKCVNVITHTVPTEKTSTIKKTGTLKMDSLVPFKIRFKTSRDDVNGLRVIVNSKLPLGDDIIHNNFMDVQISTSTPKIDTIISTKVYSKASFIMSNGMLFKNEPTYIAKNNTFISSFDNRNTIYLQEF